MKRKCPECGEEMKIDNNKYVNVIVWFCENCGKEIFICDNCG